MQRWVSTKLIVTLLPHSPHLHISQIHGVLPIYLPIYSYTNYYSLTKGKFFSQPPNKKFHNKLSARCLASTCLLLRSSTQCASPWSVANYFRDESSSISATKRLHTRAYAMPSTHTHTHTQTRARCTWRLYVGARLEVTVRSATREASLFSNALVNWPIAGSSPPTPSYSLLSLSLWSPLPSVNRGRNNLMIGSRFASIQRLLRRRASRRRFSTYLRPSSTFFLDINLFVIRTVLCISHRTLDRYWFHGKLDDRSNVLRK